MATTSAAANRAAPKLRPLTQQHLARGGSFVSHDAHGLVPASTRTEIRIPQLGVVYVRAALGPTEIHPSSCHVPHTSSPPYPRLMKDVVGVGCDWDNRVVVVIAGGGRFRYEMRSGVAAVGFAQHALALLLDRNTSSLSLGEVIVQARHDARATLLGPTGTYQQFLDRLARGEIHSGVDYARWLQVHQQNVNKDPDRPDVRVVALRLAPDGTMEEAVAARAGTMRAYYARDPRHIVRSAWEPIRHRLPSGVMAGTTRLNPQARATAVTIGINEMLSGNGIGYAGLGIQSGRSGYGLLSRPHASPVSTVDDAFAECDRRISVFATLPRRAFKTVTNVAGRAGHIVPPGHVVTPNLLSHVTAEHRTGVAYAARHIPAANGLSAKTIWDVRVGSYDIAGDNLTAASILFDPSVR